MKKIILGLIFSSLFAVCPDGFVEDDCGKNGSALTVQT